MSDSILSTLEQVQVEDDDSQTVVSKQMAPQTFNKFRCFSQEQQCQNLKVSYSTRNSCAMTSSWSQKSKSIPTAKSISNKTTIFINSNHDLGSSMGNSKVFKMLAEKDVFNCSSCENDISQDCQICQGKKHLNGGDKIIKFFEYILEFKLGKKESYKPKTQKIIAKRSSPNQHCNIYYSTLNPKFIDEETQQNQVRFSMSNDQQRIFSMLDRQQKVKNSKEIHFNYNCDKCKIDPIVGIRYHCLQCQDHDLCQICFQRFGHYHEMERIQLKNNQKTLQKISNLLKVQGPTDIRSSIRNSRDSVRNSLTSKGCKSWIR